jgi:hypothetical protein
VQPDEHTQEAGESFIAPADKIERDGIHQHADDAASLHGVSEGHKA